MKVGVPRPEVLSLFARIRHAQCQSGREVKSYALEVEAILSVALRLQILTLPKRVALV